jgi:hypothetical protein
VDPVNLTRRDFSEERKALDVDMWWLGRSQPRLERGCGPLFGAVLSKPITEIKRSTEQRNGENDDQDGDQRGSPSKARPPQPVHVIQSQEWVRFPPLARACY